jgi:integrase/recombinase XerC
MEFFFTESQLIRESLMEGVSLKVGQRTQGCVIFDDNHKVVIYPSRWLSISTELELLSFKTIPTYAYNVKYFLIFLQELNDMEGLCLDQMILMVRKHHLIKWIGYEKEKGLDKGTIRNRETTLRTLYTFLSNGEYIPKVIDTNPFPTKWLSAKPHKKLVSGATVDDLIALLHYAPSERIRATFQFMYDGAFRVSELPRVTFGDIKEAIGFINSGIGKSANEIFLPSYAPLKVKGSKGKGNSIKERLTLICRPTLERIAAYHASPLYKKYQMKYTNRDDCPAFLNSDGNPMTTATLQKIMERLSLKAFKNEDIAKKKSPHKCRHGSAFMSLNDKNLGKDFLDRIANVKKTLGHVFVSTTEQYTAIPHDVIDALNPHSNVAKTSLEQMQRVYDETKLKIKLGDKK